MSFLGWLNRTLGLEPEDFHNSKSPEVVEERRQATRASNRKFIAAASATVLMLALLMAGFIVADWFDGADELGRLVQIFTYSLAVVPLVAWRHSESVLAFYSRVWRAIRPPKP